MIVWCFMSKVFFLFSALFAKSPYYSVLYMQSVLIVEARVPTYTTTQREALVLVGPR